MANEIGYKTDGTGESWSATIQNLAGLFCKTADGSFEYAAANWSGYVIALPEHGDGYLYQGNLPAGIADGEYVLNLYNIAASTISTAIYESGPIHVVSGAIVSRVADVQFALTAQGIPADIDGGYGLGDMVNHLHAYVFNKASRASVVADWSYWNVAEDVVLITGPLPSSLARAAAVVS